MTSATTAWPSSLPDEPVRGTLVFSPEPNRWEFRPDIGRPLRRRRYTARRVIIQCEMTLTEAQRADLDDFFHDDCADGVNPFTMVDWIDGTVRTFTWEAEPQFTHVMVEIWRVALSLAREP